MKAEIMSLYDRISAIRQAITSLRRDIDKGGTDKYSRLNVDLLLVQSDLTTIGSNLLLEEYEV